jgi:hypothetical protein
MAIRLLRMVKRILGISAFLIVACPVTGKGSTPGNGFFCPWNYYLSVRDIYYYGANILKLP